MNMSSDGFLTTWNNDLLTTWRDGFLAQAIQDYTTIQAVIQGREHQIKEIEKNKKDSARNVFEPLGATLCMLFQMFFEKYCKACYCAWSGDQHPGKSHKSVQFFISQIKRSQDKNLYKPQCCELMQQLENLQPSVANANKSTDIFPQLEYPWLETTVKSSTNTKIIRSPATDLQIALRIDNNSTTDLNILFSFATLLLNKFNDITSNKINSPKKKNYSKKIKK